MVSSSPAPALPPLNADDQRRFGGNPVPVFAANLRDVQARIAEACARSGRAASDVRLLPVTKTVPAAVVRYAAAAGLGWCGENKIQEARDKQAALTDLPLNWAIIGHLQTNKVKTLVRFASSFHALDSLRLAAELNSRLDALGRDLEVYVQVNTSGEASKYGLAPDDLLPFVDRLADYPRLKPQGLMTLAVFSTDRMRVRACFQHLRRLRDQAVDRHPGLAGLSMGMSGDYDIAIEEGATVVRVGQALFGPRPRVGSPGDPDPYWPGLLT